MSRTRLAQRAQWLIARNEGGRVEVLTIGSNDEEALPVFSFEEEAQMFLRLQACTSGEGWKVRETSPGELSSVLYGPCAGVKKVALDPPPEVCGGPLLGLLSVERNEFVRALLEGQVSVPHATTPRNGRRTDLVTTSVPVRG